MKSKMMILLILPFLLSTISHPTEKKVSTKTTREKMEENPRNRAFVESFNILHSFGIVEKQEERKDKKARNQKASP